MAKQTKPVIMYFWIDNICRIKMYANNNINDKNK